MSCGSTQLHNSGGKNNQKSRFRKMGSYESKITPSDRYGKERSRNFYPLGPENEWILQWIHYDDGILVQFQSVNVVNRFVTLEFFVNGEHLPNSVSGCVCGRYTITDVSKNVFFRSFDSHEFSYGSVKVAWIWENMYCWDKNLYQEVIISFRSMLESGKFSDLVIETKDGTKIPVHRAILSARCPVFRAMLENNMIEAKTQCINISDFSPETVKNMVNYLYTSETPEYSFDSATDLLRIADKYDLSSLKSMCAGTLIANLSENNAIELLLLADVYAADSLKAKALDFIADNRSSFADRGKLQSLLKQRPELLLNAITSLSKN